jgi:hypothetical protein
MRTRNCFHAKRTFVLPRQAKGNHHRTTKATVSLLDDRALNGTAFVSEQSGLCMEATAPAITEGEEEPEAAGGSATPAAAAAAAAAPWRVIQAKCDHSNPRQAWGLNTSSMQLQLLADGASGAGAGAGGAGQCLEIPNIPTHNGQPDGHLGE